MAKVQANSGKKEALKLLENKVATMPIDIKKRLYAIADKIENSLSEKDDKIVHFFELIDSKYPSKSVCRGLYDGISAMSMDTAYSLYIQGNNSALIVELQGLLERFCINALTDLLPIDAIAKTIISEMLDKKTLKDVAQYFETYNIWSHEDVVFAKELTNLRNGIVHKNAEIVSRSKMVKSDGQSRNFESIHEMMSKVDCAEYMVKTVGLMIKATGLLHPSFLKQPRLYARYSIYTSLASEMYNLFLTNSYAQSHDSRIEAYINERLAMAYVVASEELVEKLQKFRADVLEFHKALADSNELRCIELHKGFDKQLCEIRMAMRKDLNVDGGEREWIEAPVSIDIKPYLNK